MAHETEFGFFAFPEQPGFGIADRRMRVVAPSLPMEIHPLIAVAAGRRRGRLLVFGTKAFQ